MAKVILSGPSSLMSALWLIFFWLFGVITCAFYSLVLMVHSQHYLVFAPLLAIAVFNACCLILLKKSPIMSVDKLRLLYGANKFACMVATCLFLVLSPLCMLATVGVVFFITAIPMALTHGGAETFVGLYPLAFVLYYLYVATGPVLTAGFLNVKLTTLNPQLKTIGATSYPTLFALLLSVVLLGIFPTFLTDACIAQSDKSPQSLQKCLLLLRATANEPAFISSCYQEIESTWSMFLFDGSRFDQQPRSDFVRELYYRVYGRSFNTAHHPAWGNMISFDVREIASLLMEDAAQFYDYNWQYDRDFTSDYVGGRVQGLDLTDSKIVGSVNLDECIAKLDWKMRISSKYLSDKELRAQILLPPHAVISGCSLVIDGVRHPAVFATRASSRKAYNESASRGNTPLLISTAGAGRVLLQTASGYGNTKPIELSLQITSPLTFIDSQNVALPLPLITEKNFSIKCKHEINVAAAGADAQKLDFQNDDAFDGKTALFWKRNATHNSFYAQDPGNPAGKIVETIGKYAPDRPIIFVIDGSAKMNGAVEKIADQLARLKATRATIVWASDVPIVVAVNVNTNSDEWKTAVSRLRDSAGVGGQDNASALTLALKTAGAYEDFNIVWVHGPQPFAFSGGELLPLLKSLKHSLDLFEYQIVPGPNEVIKSMDQTPALHQVPNLEGLDKDLANLFAVVSGQKTEITIDREATSAVPAGASLSADAESLQQLYYADTILVSKKDDVSVRKLGAIAEKLGIVTPATSAIVLAWKKEDKDIKVEHYGKTDLYLKSMLKNSIGAKTSDQVLSSAASTASPGGGGGSLKQAIENQVDDDSSIPVKPEPPLPVTITCAIVMMAGVVWIKRRRNQTSATS